MNNLSTWPQLEPKQLVAMRGVASATTSICACTRYCRILFVHELRLYVQHVLLIDDHACQPHYLMIVILNILVCTERIIYIQNLRVTKIVFSHSFFSLQCNSAPHQLLDLLFISFSSVSEVIVQTPSRFHHSSSVFENQVSIAYIYAQCNGCHTH